jgi:hypothetical protein
MRFVIALLLLLGMSTAAVHAAGAAKQATVYKSPTCGCCKEYVGYLRQHGYQVTAIDVEDTSAVKKRHGVPGHLESCHTTVIDGHVVEGHVPVGAIRKMLAAKPRVKGIALPGMPQGSPGMSGNKTEPFVVYEIKDGATKVFTTE